MTNIVKDIIDQPWIVQDLENLSGFRLMKAEEYPEDKRNHQAAEYCQALADAITGLGADHPVMLRYARVCDQVAESEGKLTEWNEFRQNHQPFRCTGFHSQMNTNVSPAAAADCMESEIEEMIGQLYLDEEEDKYNGCEHCQGYTESFIKQAREVHGAKYDYSKTLIECPLCAPETWESEERDRFLTWINKRESE